MLCIRQAYLCVSLDHTGLFAYVAAQVTRRAGSSYRRIVRSPPHPIASPKSIDTSECLLLSGHDCAAA